MKKSLPLLLFITAVLAACQTQTQPPENNRVAAETTQTTPAYQDLSVTEFSEKMALPDVVVLDVRTPAEIAGGKIEGAMELDFHSPGFAEKLDELDKEKTYLVYCRSGGRSGNTCTIMSEKGFKKLYNLDGGFTAWSSEK